MVLPEVWPGSAPENHFLRWNAVLCRAGCGILTMIEWDTGPAAEDWSLPASGRRAIIWYRMLGDQRFFERKITAPRALQFTSMGQEAIPISSNEMRKIHRGGEGSSSQSAAGRKVNVRQSRREQPVREPGKPGKAPKEPKEKAKHPILRFIGRTIATLLCLGIMAGSLLAVGMVFYVVQATANDGDLLDLDNIQLSQSSVVMANDPDTGAQVEYATCAPPTATACGPTWSRSPPTCSMHSSAPRTRISTTSRASTSNAPLVPWSMSICCPSTAPSRCIHAGAAAHQEPDR